MRICFLTRTRKRVSISVSTNKEMLQRIPMRYENEDTTPPRQNGKEWRSDYASLRGRSDRIEAAYGKTTYRSDGQRQTKKESGKLYWARDSTRQSSGSTSACRQQSKGTASSALSSSFSQCESADRSSTPRFGNRVRFKLNLGSASASESSNSSSSAVRLAEAKRPVPVG